MPPSPWTTNALLAPRAASASAYVRARPGGGDAEHPVPRARGVRERAEEVEDRPDPELLPHRRRVAHRGVMRPREHEPEAELVDRERDPLGSLCRASIPSASRRSAAPQAELAARLPCFATAAPAAAATIAAAVEMLNVLAPSPPVPTTSMTGVARRGHRDHPLAHRLGEARDLVGRLALRAQRDQEPCDLGR